MRLVTQPEIARTFGVTKDAVVKWRTRYRDFPKPASVDPYPRYNLDEVERWYAAKWPDRVMVSGQVKIHHFSITPGGSQVTTSTSGSLDFARGYLTGLRVGAYAEWRCFQTKEGFSAHRGNETHVYVINPTSAEPEEWYVYDSRFKATGKVA